MYGEKPNLNFVKTFLCVAYSFVEKQLRKKLDKNSRRGIFLGTSENSKAYLIRIESEGKFKVQKSRNVSFDESKFYFEKKIENDEGERVGDVVFFGEVLENILKSAKEALADPDWQEAMKKEFESLEKNKVWELVRSRGEKPIGSRWHFALKYGPNGEISRFKARFVAKGFSQVEGRDFHETYSPTAKMSTIRIVLSLAVQNRYQLRKLDIKTAYLNAKLDEELLMNKPEGFEKFDEEGKPLVCLLKKSLYGLKQSGRNWHRTLKSYLEELGFEKSAFDECLFVRRIEGVIEGLICLLVDYIVVCGADKNFCSWFESNISEKFEISEIGELKWFLGMKIDYSGNKISISQEKFVEKLISRFRMTEAKPWKAGKSCLRYLLGTKNLPLVYRRDKALNLVSYSDADWAGTIDNRRSTSGYCFKLSDNSGVISWSSRLQRCVSTSTAEAEHNAVVETVKGGIHLQGILSDLGIICNRLLEVFVDNQACIALSKHSMNHGKTKHFAIKLHFLRELVEQKKVTITFLPKANMPADALTKNLGKCKTAFFRDILLGTT